MSKTIAFPFHLEFHGVIDKSAANICEALHWNIFNMFNTDLVALVDIETGVFKNRPEVLTSCAVRHVADENLGRLPEQNILRIHPYRSWAITMIRSITSSVDSWLLSSQHQHHWSEILRVGEFHFEPLSLVRKSAQFPHSLLGALSLSLSWGHGWKFGDE